MIPSILLAEEKVIVRFDKPGKSIQSKFLSNKYDIAAYKPGHYLDLVITLSELKELKRLGNAVRSVKTESEVRKNVSNVSARKVVPAGGYHNYDNLIAELQQIERQHPDICRLVQIGESWGQKYSDQGNVFYDDYSHKLWALKISDNVEEEEDEPSIYYMGLHHARELVSVEMVMAILHHILDGYGADPTIRAHVDNSQIWFIPLVNPDGHRVVEEQVDVWWRKNIRDNNENGEFDTDVSNGTGTDGVDLNRNYGFEWGGFGASDSCRSALYRGPYPWSEPEIEAIKKFLESHHFVAGISYHSYGEQVLFPYSYTYLADAPDHQALSELAIRMAETIPDASGGTYLPQASWQLYPASGTTEDYAYGAHGIFSYTIELGTEFIPPENQLAAITGDNIEAAMILLDRVNYSTLTGRVTDAQTGEPVVAEIFVDGIDTSGLYRNPYTSDQAFGRYYRMLPEGNYDVVISADNYKTVVYENIAITANAQALLDVDMTPVTDTSMVDIQANGTDDPLLLLKGQPLSITIALDAGQYAGQQTDWWLLAETPAGWYHFDMATGWVPGTSVTYQGSLFTLQPMLVLNRSDLPTGFYRFYFGVDGQMNGVIDYGTLHYDTAEINIDP